MKHRESDQEIVADALQYPTRNEWKKGNHGLYQHVHKRRRHLIPACTAHMGDPVKDYRFNYQVYAYEFEDSTAYIGLTCSPKARHYWHRKKGPVFLKSGTNFTLREITRELTVDQAKKVESEQIVAYRDAGWTLLNESDGGETGGSVRAQFPTYESVLEYARNHGCKKKKKADLPLAAQHACFRKDWMARLTSDMGWLKHAGRVPLTWTYEACRDEAKKHRNNADWIAAEGGSYNAAYRYGWLEKIRDEVGHILHANRGKITKWTYEACLADSKRHTTRSEWQKSSASAYCRAQRSGWLGAISGANRWPWRSTS